MMESAEDRDPDDLGSLGRTWWREVISTIGRLHAKPAMGPTKVEGDVLAEDALGMVLVANDDVVEAIPTESADRALTESVGLGRSRRRGEQTGTEPADAASKVGAVD